MNNEQQSEKRTDAVDFSFEGAADFRWRLLLAAILGRSLHIGNIRVTQEVGGGMNNAEVTFLELLRVLVPNSTIRYNSSRRWVIFRPGIVTGGLDISFDASHANASLSWFLEPLSVLLLFAHAPLSRIQLTGATADGSHSSVDYFRTVTASTLRALGATVNVRIDHRGLPGAAEGLQGRVTLDVSSIRSGTELTVVDWLNPGNFKGVYGVAWSTGGLARAAAEASRAATETLRQAGCPIITLNDRDCSRRGGRAYGITLFAQSTSGALLGGEAFDQPTSGDFDAAAVGRLAALRVLDEMAAAGCVDRATQPLLATIMALGAPDYQRLRTGPLTTRTVATLRLLLRMAGVRFAVKTDAEIMAEARAARARANDAGTEADTFAAGGDADSPTVVLTCSGRAVAGAQTYY